MLIKTKIQVRDDISKHYHTHKIAGITERCLTCFTTRKKDKYRVEEEEEEPSDEEEEAETSSKKKKPVDVNTLEEFVICDYFAPSLVETLLAKGVKVNN